MSTVKNERKPYNGASNLVNYCGDHYVIDVNIEVKLFLTLECVFGS